jgi:hypothetical protein
MKLCRWSIGLSYAPVASSCGPPAEGRTSYIVCGRPARPPVFVRGGGAAYRSSVLELGFGLMRWALAGGALGAWPACCACWFGGMK